MSASRGTEGHKEESTSKSTPENSASTLVKTRECQNCGRRFFGDYCPNCGQEVARAPSVLEVVSVFFRELADIEGGLWPTLRDLTMRPGPALAGYLRGARKRLMHPGRYLLAAIVVAFATRQVFTWIGAREPYDERVSGTVTESASPELDPEVTGGIQSVLVSTAEQVVESQGFLVGSYLVLSGLLSLTVWRLFRSQFEQGAQAVAFSVFTVAHTVFLGTAARLLYVPTAYLSSGQAAGFPSALTYGITAAYVGIVFPWALGGGVKASAKGLLALSWAALEEALILGIAISAFLLWRIQNRLPQISLTDSPKVVFNWGGTIVELEMLYLLSIPLVPLLLHVALETYYRLR